jgi:hypothetical protein
MAGDSNGSLDLWQMVGREEGGDGRKRSRAWSRLLGMGRRRKGPKVWWIWTM